MQGCFKLLAALLRACPGHKPQLRRLRAVFGWAFLDFADAAARPAQFALLRAVLERRLVAVVEVYDVMLRVQVRLWNLLCMMQLRGMQQAE